MKYLEKNQMIEWVSKTIPVLDSDTDTRSIVIDATEHAEYKGKDIYWYYSENYSEYDLGVLKIWEDELQKRGWWSEWRNSEIIVLHKLNW